MKDGFIWVSIGRTRRERKGKRVSGLDDGLKVSKNDLIYIFHIKIVWVLFYF